MASARLMARSPEPGATASAEAPLTIALGVPPEWSAGGALDLGAVRVVVDGADVTAACETRVAATWPPRRVDLVYRPPGGWPAGEHEVALTAPTATWTFTVAGAGARSAPGRPT